MAKKDEKQNQAETKAAVFAAMCKKSAQLRPTAIEFECRESRLTASLMPVGCDGEAMFEVGDARLTIAEATGLAHWILSLTE